MYLKCLIIWLGLVAHTQAQVTVIQQIKGYTLIDDDFDSIVDKLNYQWQPFSSIAFENGKIIAISQGNLAQQFSDANVINGQGMVMLPGLIDAHGHILNLGKSRLAVDLRGVRSIAEMMTNVRRYAQQHPQLTWITGRGWDQERWADKKYPSLQDLPETQLDRPVWLMRVDGHAGWANQQALALAGITQATVDPDGGLIMRDSQGVPTGVLVDNAMSLLTAVIPPTTKEHDQHALDIAQQHLLSVGITSVHDAGISYDNYMLYQENMRTQRLKLRIYAMLNARDPQLIKLLKAGYVNDPQDMLSVRSVKLLIDGALGSRGAAMLTGYNDMPQQKGLLLWSDKQLKSMFELVLSHQFQLNVHAIGDKGNQVVLDHFALFQRLGGKPLRHRIEHAQVVTLADIKRFKTLNIIPSMQPIHATSDMYMAQDRVGEQRLQGAYAWQRFLQQGSRIAAGSDFPVELADPMYGIHAAVTRQNRDQQPVGGWRSQQAMNVGQALRAFTIDAAYAAHQENVIGTLEVGKWADFILIDQDIFSLDKSKLWQIKVLQTWIAGEMRFRAK